MLVNQLEQVTRRWHPDVDEPWLEMFRLDVTKRDYIHQLVRMYGFESQLESAFSRTLTLRYVVKPQRIMRAKTIARDLFALGLTPWDLAAAPVCTPITPFSTVHQALGWLYVVERINVQHLGLGKHLQRRLRGMERSCAYLSMFDTETNHWEPFGEVLERVTFRHEQVVHIMDSAKAGFELMKRWFESTTPRLRRAG